MSAQLEAREDIRVVILEAINLASDLNVSWTYVAIAPLFPPSLIVRLVRCPPGWRTNAVAAKKALPHTRGSIDIRTRISQRKGVRATLNQMPLAPALVALKAYRASDEVVRLLIELHFQALSLHGSQASLILRAKALELCRAILPGRGDKSRQDALQPEIRHRMQRTYSWLMNIANNRVDVRHVFKDREALKMHPRIAPDERKAYLHDADLVIRGVIAAQLKIPLVLADNW